MADNMMRIAGRNESGLAKALSVIDDDNGNGVLKIVDAAPFAYDPSSDAINVNIKSQMKIVKQTMNENISVASGGAKLLLTVMPPEGKVWKVLFLSFRYPAVIGATTGTHQAALRYGWNESLTNVLRGITAYNKIIDFSNGMFATSTDTQVPSDLLMQKMSLQDIVISVGTPLYLEYQNSTDATQTGLRTFFLVVSESDEA